MSMHPVPRPKKRLRSQFILMLMLWLVLPILVIFAFLVGQSVDQIKINNRDVLQKTAEIIASDFSNMTYTLFNISDNFANDEALLEMLQTDYHDSMELKRLQMVTMKNRFVEADTFSSSLMIDAIYTRSGDVFNFYTGKSRQVTGFYDPLPRDAIARIQALNVDDRENLAKIIWYPLQDNYFQPQPTGNLRQDLMLLGSRRTYHRHLGYYLNTHLFVIPEQTLFDRYSGYLIGDGMTVYVLDQLGGLLSSSDVQALMQEGIPRELAGIPLEAETTGSAEFKMQGNTHLLGYALSESNNWTVLTTLPTSVATRSVTTLVFQMLLVGVLISLLFLLAIILFSRRISRPLGTMIESMQHVEQGSFVPAPVPDTRNEIEQLTLYYNQMVTHLQALIEDRYEKEKRSKDLEAKVLMGQINPHFMYNTLESIVWKAHEAGNPDIARIAAQLGHLLRMSIRDGSPFIPFSQEIAQTLVYVDIQKTRYKERLQVTIPDTTKLSENLSTLRFVLQPSIENAIVHGMRPNESMLCVEVLVDVTQDGLVLTITDNGLGMSADRLDAVRAYIQSDENPDQSVATGGSTGIGIRNIHQRLLLYFGDAYGLTIESTPGMGTRVRIRMPRMAIASPEQEKP